MDKPRQIRRGKKREIDEEFPNALGEPTNSNATNPMEKKPERN